MSGAETIVEILRLKRLAWGGIMDRRPALQDTLLLDTMVEAADEIERLQRLLTGRDQFIVKQGLWSDFTMTFHRADPTSQ
jgi:hypothetical protein